MSLLSGNGREPTRFAARVAAVGGAEIFEEGRCLAYLLCLLCPCLGRELVKGIDVSVQQVIVQPLCFVRLELATRHHNVTL